MKIKTQEDLDRLDRKIQQELGVDLKQYANPEVAARFMEMLLFPAYAFFWFSVPILVFVSLFISGYWYPSFTSYDVVGYSTFGLFFMLLASISFSVLFVLYQTKKDVLSILTYSLEVTQQVLRDAKHLDGRVPVSDRSHVRKLLFHGVIHLVTIPSVTQIVADKIPIIGGVFSGLIKKTLRLMTTKVNFDDSVCLNTGIDGNETFTESSIHRIEQIKQVINVLFWSGFVVVGLPLALLFFMFLLGFITTIWILLA